MISERGQAVGSQSQGRTVLSQLYLTINQSLYLVERLECEPGAAVRAFRLNKGEWHSLRRGRDAIRSRVRLSRLYLPPRRA